MTERAASLKQDSIVTNEPINRRQTITNQISVSNLPYEPLFVTANEEEISVILKNIKNVLYDDSILVDKTAKVCNFQVKSKPANDDSNSGIA